MLFIDVFELALLVLLAATFLTQILIPFVKGTRLFPIFGKERELSENLVAAEDELQAAQLEKTADTVRRQAQGVRERTGGPTPVVPISEDSTHEVHADATGSDSNQIPASETQNQQ